MTQMDKYKESHHETQVTRFQYFFPCRKRSIVIHHDEASEDHPGKVSCKATEIEDEEEHTKDYCGTITLIYLRNYIEQHKKQQGMKEEELHQKPVMFEFFFPDLKCLIVIRGVTSEDHPGKVSRKAKEIGKSGIDATHHQRIVELTTIRRKNLVNLEKCFEPHKHQQEIELKEVVMKYCKYLYGERHSDDHPAKGLRAKEIGKSGFATHHKETVESTNESEESEEGKEELTKDYEKKLDYLENCFEQQKQQEMQLKECKERCAKNKKKQEEEMKEFHEVHIQNMQKMKDTFEKQINEAKRNFKKKLTQINEVKMRLNQDIPTLKTENDGMIDEPEDYWLSYIGKVCLNLQANMYHIVLPDQFAEDWFYKVKDIERDIRDEQLLDDREREAASRRWEELKGKLHWDPSLEKTLKMLQKDGNSMDRTECLTVEEAERVAEELNKQGRLRGRTSHARVKQIIEMWKTSTTLIN